MRVGFFSLAVLLGAAVPCASPATAEGFAKNTVPTKLIHADIPFDPPLDRDLRYRFTSDVVKDGKTISSWSILTIRFFRSSKGFRMRVRETDSGSNETSETVLAVERGLAVLSERPYILNLDENGAVTGMEDSETYWSTIFSVMQTEIGKVAKSAEGRAALESLLKGFEAMPADGRLNLLTQNIVPITEFASTYTEEAKPFVLENEADTPFGIKIKRQTTVRLKAVTADAAEIEVRTILPKAEFERLMSALPKKLSALKKQDTAIQVTRYDQSNSATYDVNLASGLLSHWRMEEIFEVATNEPGDNTTRRSKVKTLTAIQ